MAESKCAFHSNDQFSICQFGADADEELYLCGSERFCRFHLPLADKNGQPTDKKDKATGPNFDPDEFNRAIHKLIDDAHRKEEEVNLNGVVFPGDFICKDKELPGIQLYRAVFPGYVNFKNARFTGDANFHETQFKGTVALFHGAEFMGDANFLDTWFGATAVFGRAQFTGIAVFKGARFKREAGFKGARFMDHALFTDAWFTGGANFVGARFTCQANLHNTWFAGYAYFQDAQFESHADFSWSPSSLSWDTSRQDDEFVPDASFRFLDFSGGRVGGDANFNDRIFTKAPNFSGRTFAKAPLFHGCKLHQGTEWKGSEFLERKGEVAEKAYRTLRWAMEEMRDRPQEAIFFSLEHETKRGNMARWNMAWWMSLLYQITSDYGQSIVRPTVCWLLTPVVFLPIYWWGTGQPMNWSVIKFTILQTVKPFGAWGKVHPDLIALFPCEILFWIQLLATIHSVFSLTFIALLILALRWLFKRS